MPDIISNTPLGDMLNLILASWGRLAASKPLIVLFDELDLLQDTTMPSFLRQLQGGMGKRRVGIFPISIALPGMRDLNEYLLSTKDSKAVNPEAPFNSKVDSAVLFNFAHDYTKSLFAQRTEETGQQISGAALDYLYEQSKGQP